MAYAARGTRGNACQTRAPNDSALHAQRPLIEETAMDPRFRREILDILSEASDLTSQPCARTAIRRRRRSATRTTIWRSTSAPVLARKRRKTSPGTQRSPPPSTFPIATGARSGVSRCLERRSGSPTRPTSLVLKSFSCGGFRSPSPSMHWRPLDNVIFFRVRPEVISVLDYRKGFGHTDLVEFSSRGAPSEALIRARWPAPTAQLTDAPATEPRSCR